MSLEALAYPACLFSRLPSVAKRLLALFWCYRGVTPDANSYSNAIIACDLSGMWAEAVALLDDMRDNAGLE